MAFHDYQKAYDYQMPIRTDGIHVSFIEVDQMHTALQNMYDEICNDKPDLDKLFLNMQYVASKYNLDFDEEYFEKK